MVLVHSAVGCTLWLTFRLKLRTFCRFLFPSTWCWPNARESQGTRIFSIHLTGRYLNLLLWDWLRWKFYLMQMYRRRYLSILRSSQIHPNQADRYLGSLTLRQHTRKFLSRARNTFSVRFQYQLAKIKRQRLGLTRKSTAVCLDLHHRLTWWICSLSKAWCPH